MGKPSPPGHWDDDWYRVETEHFKIEFLSIRRDEDLDAVCNVDVSVYPGDGTRWTATVFTLDEVARIMARWAETGEALGGRYFWCSDGLIVREPGIRSITEVLVGLHEDGELYDVLRRLEDDEDDEDPGIDAPPSIGEGETSTPPPPNVRISTHSSR